MRRKAIWDWFVERFYGALDNAVAAFFLASLGYLVGVLSGWLPGVEIDLPRPIRILLATAIGALIPVAIVWFFDIRSYRRKHGLIRPIWIPRGGTRPSLDLQRLGLSQYVEPDSRLLGNPYHFSVIQQTYMITGHDARYVLRYKGTNIGSQVCRFFRDRVVGDSPADISLMQISVLDRSRRTPLSWGLASDGTYEKMIEAYFLQPLRPEDSFDIEISCKWPGTSTRRDDYVFFPIHYYEFGVDRFIGELVLDAPPSYIEGIRFDGEKIELEPTQPEIHRRGAKHIVTWQLEDPKYIYILQFGRQDL